MTFKIYLTYRLFFVIIKKLIFIGSACIYPKFAEQPISENELLNGYLEKTNEPYAVAKIAGIKLCQSYFEQYKNNFISLMPNNLYGPNDNFDLETSHVIPALIRKFHHQASLKIKMEVDVDPPGEFATEVKPLLQPFPFYVKTYTLADMFSGKLHALLCRNWQKRVKGRDWYDFIWLLGLGAMPNLNHLKARLVQSGHWPADQSFDAQCLQQLLKERVEQTDFKLAAADVRPFLEDPQMLQVWSKEYFMGLLPRLV